MNINGNLTVNAKNALDVRGRSTTNINTDGKHSTVLNGDIVFETPATPQNNHSSGNIIDANVNVNLTGKGSSWAGCAYQEYNRSIKRMMLTVNTSMSSKWILSHIKVMSLDLSSPWLTVLRGT